MSEDKDIMKVGKSIALGKAGKLITATNKLLQNYLTDEQKKLVSFLIDDARRRNFSIELLSTFYPFSINLLEKYKAILDWKEIGGNENLSWSYDLINRFRNELNVKDDSCYGYKALDSNEAVPWTAEILALTNDRAYGTNYSLTNNGNLTWTLEILEAGKTFWCWENLSISHNLPWSIELIEKFSDKWIWIDLSRNMSLPWSPELLERFFDYWTWQALAHNTGLSWTIEMIEKLFDKQNSDRFLAFNIICYKARWSMEMIEHFKGKLRWSSLSKNPELPWSIELIDKYLEKWDWGEVCKNKGVDFDIELIENYKSRSWISDYGIPINPEHPNLAELIQNYRHYINLRSYASIIDIQFSIEDIHGLKDVKGFMVGLSSNKNLYWTIELIDHFCEFWDWKELSANTGIDWTIELIEKFQNHWDWEKLSYNRNIPWTVELIDKFKYQLKWVDLEDYPKIIWSEQFLLKLYGLAYYNCIDNEGYSFEWHWKKFWDRLNYSSIMPWSKITIERFIEDIDWITLSTYGCFENPIVLFGEYKNRWDWTRLSRNENLAWSVELIDAYKTEWDWESLSYNENLPWSVELLEKYLHKWDWEGLSGNTNLPWSQELIETYQKKWSVLYGLGHDFDKKWTEILIDAYNANQPWVALVMKEVFYKVICLEAKINDMVVVTVMDKINIKQNGK